MLDVKPYIPTNQVFFNKYLTIIRMIALSMNGVLSFAEMSASFNLLYNVALDISSILQSWSS